jgi:hypothetical protein
MSEEIYRSPQFEAPIDLWDNTDNMCLDDFVCYEEDNFCINGDLEGHDDNIIFLMFDPFDHKWISKFFGVWEKQFGFALPKFREWEEIESLDEAYTQ